MSRSPNAPIKAAAELGFDHPFEVPVLAYVLPASAFINDLL
jgi:hypothetical protein